MRDSDVPRFSARLVVILLLGLAGGLVGCGGPEEGETTDWVVNRGALTLERTLLAGDDEEYFFGEINDVAVRDDGRIYVADGQISHVKVLAQDGTLRDSIGRQGEGPGEFADPSQVVVARSDSLYVFDRRRSQVSIFAPDGQFVYSFMARLDDGGVGELMVSSEGSGFIFVDDPSALEVVKTNSPYVVRPGWRTGAFGDTLLVAPPPQVKLVDVKGRSAYVYLPFIRGSSFALGPNDLIHYGWEDSLRVEAYDLDGVRQREIEIPFEHVPVTEEEREDALANMPAALRSTVEDEVPSTKPAFDDFLVDDRGRYWFERPTVRSDSTDWWVADPEEKRVATTRTADDVRIFTVRDEAAYGRTTTADGAPAVVRYRIRLAQ